MHDCIVLKGIHIRELILSSKRPFEVGRDDFQPCRVRELNLRVNEQRHLALRRWSETRTQVIQLLRHLLSVDGGTWADVSHIWIPVGMWGICT